MIYTVTFNPAVDYVVDISSLEQGMVNRTESEKIFFGGKGINVSVVLKELGIESAAMGFAAGFTGDALEKFLEEKRINHDFVKLDKGFSRINIKIRSKNNNEHETELNGQGPEIDEKSLEALIKKLDVLKKGDTLVLAGSIPKSLPDDIYEKIIAEYFGREVRFAVDASGKLLMNVLKYKPFLIKPNNFELAEMLGAEINTDEDVVFYARKLREYGACNVIVSMAENGAILVDENDCVHKLGVPSGKTVNAVGAGDSMLAGFLAGLDKFGSYDKAFAMAAAAGSATAYSEGLASGKLIEKLYMELA